MLEAGSRREFVRRSRGARRAARCVASGLLALSACLPLVASAAPPRDVLWTGSVAKNPGFEEDFVNVNAEGHVLSFKGDWFYNQKDLIPDMWQLTGEWTWSADAPNSGKRTLKLGTGTATQSYPMIVFQDGGSAWAGATFSPIVVADAAKLKQPWRATVMVRGGGSITLGTATAKGDGSPTWKPLTVELPADQVDVGKPLAVTLTGPGEFDDLVVQEKRGDSPNLIANAGFETADADGKPAGWSSPRKYRHIGPTYYVWTDWNHAFRDVRGAVTVDRLVSYSGEQSLRFDVLPGDEKYVESDAIAINQAANGVIEVGVFVRADRIKLFDIRCINENGADLKGVYPTQPEYATGGTATWGNGTFEWRYVRKFFAAPFDQPMKSIRVRLCARGFNAHTLDDSGTRSYACQVGTVWWDNLSVIERGSDAAAIKARGVATHPHADVTTGKLGEPRVHLGDRLFGANSLQYEVNPPAAGKYSVRLTTTLPGSKPVVTQSAEVAAAAGQAATLEAPYEIASLAGHLKEQGTLKLELLSNGQPVAASTYSFNTWPVVIDFDVARSYSLPNENPVSVSLNLGVASATLAKVKTVELALARASKPDEIVEKLAPIVDLPKAFAETIAKLPKTKDASYEFNLPTPDWWTDRTNLLLMKVDLGRLKVWPHDDPVRDTVLVVRGLDAAGNVLFTDRSDPFGRMAAPPALPEIQTVAVREDGALLINGKPKLLTGATHQNQRVTHTPAIVAQLGLDGMRLVDGAAAKFDHMANEIWGKHRLYVHQARPISGFGSTTPVIELTDAQKKELADFAAAGGMKSIVSMNTGGWESHIPDTPDARAKHIATNDFVYATTKRPLSWSHSGGYNAWNTPTFPYYDINFAETEMWGPMDYNVIWTPWLKRSFARPSTWGYLPQLYENHPYERYRFETYENMLRGSIGTLMIQGIGDPTFNRGLAGELRRLEAPFFSLEPPPKVTLEPNVPHKVTQHAGKTYVVATNAGPIQIGHWKWTTDEKQSGAASHEGDTVNTMWFRPAGIRVHGFRGLSMPELVQKGDKIVQHVWLDPKETPDWAMFAVRGNGQFIHNGFVGGFDFAKFRGEYGNVVMYSELNHSIWHEINWVFDPPTREMAVRLMGQAWADGMFKSADQYRATIDRIAYQPAHFHKLGEKPAAGKWVRLELDADKAGLTGKLVDGFAYLTQNGRALWDHSILERDGKPVRVFCEDSVGIDRALLKSVKVTVPGLKAGTKVRALFEDREIVAADGSFEDNFEGTDTYQEEAGGVEGDLVGYVKDPNRELPRMMPSGHGYRYGPTAVHIYEIGP